MEPVAAGHVCDLIIRSRLLAPDEVQDLYKRWRSDTGIPGSEELPFLPWLVTQQVLTEYQANLLLRGKAGYFVLDQYKILDRVGKGRMAGVYKAVHPQGQFVAIKVLPPSKAKDPQILSRFQREARLALRLKHPNVVRTFQVGEIDGLHYIVMEHLEGETLEEVLDRRRQLPPAEAIRLIQQACLGLEHLNEEGLVHRDLKPGNLMLTPARKEGSPDTTLDATVKILDIGLGRAFFDEGGGVDNFQLTNEGAILGTPDYMAPEQARNARQADIRADIYSLGCILFHALTGKPPFPDTNLVRQLMRHATEVPRPIREVNPAAPEGLQHIVNSMMAKDPAGRYPTPERASQALLGLLASGAGARPAGGASKTVSWKSADLHPTAPLAAETPSGKGPPPAPSTGPSVAPRTQAFATPPLGGGQAPRGPTPPTGLSPVPSDRAGPARPKKVVREVTIVEAVEVELVPETEKAIDQPWFTPLARLSRRDYLLLGIGAAILLLLELVGITVWQLFFRKKDGGDANRTEDQEQ
jgi:serine/threonine protein kinase